MAPLTHWKKTCIGYDIDYKTSGQSDSLAKGRKLEKYVIKELIKKVNPFTVCGFINNYHYIVFKKSFLQAKYRKHEI